MERDLLVSTRLNHLHVMLLLRMALVRRIIEPDDRLIATSTDILRLVVDAVILRHDLGNSGTSLVWKVCRALSDA